LAAQDRPDQVGLDLPRRIAARLVERLGLTPPVDIRALLSDYADLEEVYIPTDCDGLVIGLNKAEIARPHVVINSDKPPRRRRFSMAHELGHILIPGHVGIEVCYVGDGSFYGSSYDESEAQEFASETLMPTAWLTEILAGSENAGEVIHATGEADVSASAALLAINRILPPGHIVALIEPGNVVEMSLASPGTQANRPGQGVVLDRKTIDPFAGDHGSALISGRRVLWWAFDTEAEMPPDDDERTASEVLREIVAAVYPDDERQQQYTLSSINGVAGYAKGGFGEARSAQEMLARLRGRIAGRGQHAPVVQHPLFETYLAKKARELAGQRG
jgi:hypothetical protein